MLTVKDFVKTGQNISGLRLSNGRVYSALNMGGPGYIKMQGDGVGDIVYIMRKSIADENIIGAIAYTELSEGFVRIGQLILEGVRAQGNGNVPQEIDEEILGRVATGIVLSAYHRDKEAAKKAAEEAESKKS